MTSKLLSLRDSAAQGLDPYQLYMLKGESYIGLKMTAPAIEAFSAAAKATSDPHELAFAKCTVLLLKNSNATTYVPKTAPAGGVKPGPIPLNDPAQRAAAFSALLDDQLAALQPKIDAASKSPQIPPIYPVVQQLADLKNLDLVANGNDDRTIKISTALLEHAHNMIVAALKGMWAREDEINKNANQTTVNTQINPLVNNTVPGAGNITTVQQAGLSDDNRNELKDMIDLCGKIHDAADTLMAMSSADKDKEWAAVISDAGRIASRANDMLNFVASPVYTSAYPYGVAPGQYIAPLQGFTQLQPGQAIIIPPQQMIPTTNPTVIPTIPPTVSTTPTPVVTPTPTPVISPPPSPPRRAKPPKNPINPSNP